MVRRQSRDRSAARGNAGRGGRVQFSDSQREAIERRWFRQLSDRPDLAALVTGESLRDEPLHRWLPYKQAFSPELVRRFIREALDDEGSPAAPGRLPLLDPFAGSGVFPIECARRGIAAIGVEALPSLVFLASSRCATSVPDLPDLAGCETWTDFASRLAEPMHRAALLCAIARQYTRDGKPLADPPPLAELLSAVLAMMREDVRSPPPTPVRVLQGDARELSAMADTSVGGILTSPPYLSRHDYTRITRPIEQAYAFWHGDTATAGETRITERRAKQVRAHPRAYAQRWESEPHPAVAEACDALRDAGEPKWAGVARSYFEDMGAALLECARVLAPGGPCWIVIGGARLKDVYVPADLILAEMARDRGFDVRELRVARRLIASGRKLGGLTDVAPRETILILNRRRQEPDDRE